MELTEEVQKKFEGLTEKLQESIKKSVNETGEAMKISLREELLKEGVSKEDVDALIVKNAKEFEAVIKKLNERVDNFEINSQKDGNQSVTKSFGQNLEAALEANLASLKKLSSDNKATATEGAVSIEVKAVGDMTSANISGGNVPVEDRLAGLNLVPSRRVRVLDLLSPRSTNSNIVSWTYQSGKEGTAGQTAEGAAKNQIDFNIVVASQTLKKTTAYIKISTEMLEDIAWIRSEIEGELMREVLKAVEAQVYSGDNTGQNLNGVYTTATAWAAGTFADTVANPNIVDVLVVGINQIKIAEHDMDRPFILMHPSDVTSLRLQKVSDTDKRYNERLVEVGDRLFLGTIPIIETTLVTVDKFLIGDFMKAILVQKGGIRFEIGLDGNDFTKNMRTILAEWRGLVIVKNNDRTAFVKGDFSDAIADLVIPAA